MPEHAKSSIGTQPPGSPPVIVGAGPAGVRAAQTLLAAGVRPIVLDEAARAGGQIYRQPPPGFTRSTRTLYGSEAPKAEAIHRAMNDMAPLIDYRPGTLVWNAMPGQLDTLCDGQHDSVPYSHLILATGATDRVLPLPGWLTPGVYTLGAAQIALKYQGCAIGSRVVFMGTGPLLYLVAHQYRKAGAQVAAVLDTATARDRLAALPGMLRAPRMLALGLHMMASLRAHGVPLYAGIRPSRIEGSDSVQAVVFKDAQDVERRIDCDAIGYGLALRPETQLASLLNCGFEFDPRDRAWLPVRDAAGRSSVEGIYLAGDGAGILGADAAEIAGERAALAVLADMGMNVPAQRIAHLDRALNAQQRLRHALARTFPYPTDWAMALDDDVVLCRCEEIRVGALRQAATECGVRELNRLKALTRIGMGRCQGRSCGSAAAELLEQATSVPIDAVGRLRTQAPIKPFPLPVSPAWQSPSRAHAPEGSPR